MSDLARGEQSNNYIIDETDRDGYASWSRIDTLNIKGDTISMVLFCAKHSMAWNHSSDLICGQISVIILGEYGI